MAVRKLTTAAVKEELKDPAPRIVWDSLIPGFGLRIRGTDRAGWLFKYRVKGDRAAYWLSYKFPRYTADQARAWARRKQTILDEGGDPGPVKDETEQPPPPAPESSIPTLAAYVDRYLTRKASGESHKSGKKAKASTLLVDRGNLERIVRDYPKTAAKQLHEITQGDVEAIVRRKDHPVSGNRRLALLRHLLNVAAEDPTFALRSARTSAGERWQNPCSGLGQTHEKKRQPRPGPDVWPRLFALLDRYSKRPTREDLKAKRRRAQIGEQLTETGNLSARPTGTDDTASESNPVIASLIRLQALTGARGSEIRTARRSLIAIHETPGEGKGKPIRTGTLTVIDPKEGGRKEIPLSVEAVSVIDSLPVIKGCDYVFPGRTLKDPIDITTVMHWWSRHRAEAGLEGFRLHDLRHFVAGELVAAGASLTQIGELFGHKSAQTTMRYAYLDDSKKKELAALVAERISSMARARS